MAAELLVGRDTPLAHVPRGHRSRRGRRSGFYSRFYSAARYGPVWTGTSGRHRRAPSQLSTIGDGSGRAVTRYDALITRRSQVQILPPPPSENAQVSDLGLRRFFFRRCSSGRSYDVPPFSLMSVPWWGPRPLAGQSQPDDSSPARSASAFSMPRSSTSSASCRSARARESCSVPISRAKRLSVVARADSGSSGSQAGGDLVGDGQHAVGVGLLRGGRAATDLIEQGGRRAAVLGVVAVPDREVLAHQLLDAGARPLPVGLALLAQLVGDRGGDEVLLGRRSGRRRRRWSDRRRP